MEQGSIGNRKCASLTALLCGRTGLLVLVSGYALLGALLFKTLEGGDEGNLPFHIQRSREDCLRELWLITDNLIKRGCRNVEICKELENLDYCNTCETDLCNNSTRTSLSFLVIIISPFIIFQLC